MIAFTADAFHASLATPFFVDMTQKVLVEGFDLSDAFLHILASTSSSQMARHTNVFYMQNGGSKRPCTIQQFVWSHENERPFGRRLPSACSSCFCPRSWDKPVKVSSVGKPTVYKFRCRYTDKAGKRCEKVVEARPMEGFEPTGAKSGHSRWMVRKTVLGALTS